MSAQDESGLIPIRFFDPYAEIQMTENKLPHWQQPGATYFFTWRLVDAVPVSLLSGWNEEKAAWLRHHPEPWSEGERKEFETRFLLAMEKWLDAGYGRCVLRDGVVREIVMDSLRHFDGVRYRLLAWVVMPNHVHVVASMHPAWEMGQVLGGWKGYTALLINRWLGEEGGLWQEDAYNRLVRDAAHFGRVVRYIERNPEKAGLGGEDFGLFVAEGCAGGSLPSDYGG